MDKKELLEELEEGQQEIIDMLAGLPDEALLEPGVAGDWSVKDILAHLSYWEGQLVTLLFQAQRMPKPTTVHFGKEKMDELNERWRAAGKDRALEMVWQDWLGVRKQTIRRVEEFSDKDLSDPERYPWLKGVPLWQWIANDTLEHEDEHADQIREWLGPARSRKKATGVSFPGRTGLSKAGPGIEIIPWLCSAWLLRNQERRSRAAITRPPTLLTISQSPL